MERNSRALGYLTDIYIETAGADTQRLQPEAQRLLQAKLVHHLNANHRSSSTAHHRTDIGSVDRSNMANESGDRQRSRRSSLVKHDSKENLNNDKNRHHNGTKRGGAVTNNDANSLTAYPACLQWIRAHKTEVAILCDMLHLYPSLIRDRALDPIWELVCETEPYYLSTRKPPQLRSLRQESTEKRNRLSRNHSQLPADTAQKITQLPPISSVDHPLKPPLLTTPQDTVEDDGSNTNGFDDSLAAATGGGLLTAASPKGFMVNSRSFPNLSSGYNSLSDNTVGYTPKIYMMEEKLLAQAIAAARSGEEQYAFPAAESSAESPSRRAYFVFRKLEHRASNVASILAAANKRPELYRMNSNDDLGMDEHSFTHAPSVSPPLSLSTSRSSSPAHIAESLSGRKK